ncbi:MAG: hypothetical protein QGG71_08855 [Pirellulaceae bacterium]|nr:hypothetical protein [Pirellulaceae bacterium]
MTTRGPNLTRVAERQYFGNSFVVSCDFFFDVRPGRVAGVVVETGDIVVAVWPLANAELLAGSGPAGSSVGSSGQAENGCHSSYAGTAAVANSQR